MSITIGHTTPESRKMFTEGGPPYNKRGQLARYARRVPAPLRCASAAAANRYASWWR